MIGAGIGGLTAAALLAKDGYDVTVLEAQTYPGGSASTFYHKGYRFESGATLAGGFQPNGPHAVVGEMLDLDWDVHRSDTAWVVHMPGRTVTLDNTNADVIANFPHSKSFWEEQARIADQGWSLSAQGLPWPPTDMSEILQIAKVGITNLPSDLQIIPFALMSTRQWMALRGLAHDREFKRFIDGQLLISAQTKSDGAYALYSATALDLARQGVYHAKGGIGSIAAQLVAKLESFGGRIEYRRHVKRIDVEFGQARGVYATKGRRRADEDFFEADVVLANVTPWNLEAMLGPETPPELHRENKRQRAGYGAFVLHVGLDASKLPDGFAEHHQFLMDIEGTLGEGRSLFLSLSPEWDDSRAPSGMRAATITTHTDVGQWWDLLETDEDAYYARKGAYQRTFLSNIDRYVPGFSDAVDMILPGSPVTYQFYTMRHRGMVGGFPATSLFKVRGPRTGVSNVRLVGDSIFPGQSTAGVSLGGIRVAEDIKRNIPTRRITSMPQHQKELV
ncbi:MAG: NAD(P)/FAD-dependent oxidoreductase [Chloroflexota bacterium]